MLVGLVYVLLYLFVVGMAAGWFAWVVLGKSKLLKRPDKKPNYALLLGLGVIGSFVGGLGVSLLAGQGFALAPSGMLASVIGAIVIVAAYTALKDRSA